MHFEGSADVSRINYNLNFNQKSIKLKYFSQNDNGLGFVNDVALESKTEFNDKINSIVPPENKRHTRK